MTVTCAVSIRTTRYTREYSTRATYLELRLTVLRELLILVGVLPQLRELILHVIQLLHFGEDVVCVESWSVNRLGRGVCIYLFLYIYKYAHR
jgi:hypothetical protein